MPIFHACLTFRSRNERTALKKVQDMIKTPSAPNPCFIALGKKLSTIQEIHKDYPDFAKYLKR